LELNRLQDGASRDPIAERFCSNYTARLPVGEKTSLVYSAADRSARILNSHLAILLDRCRSFKTLDEHARKCALSFTASNSAGEPVKVDLIRKHLSMLAESGLLISETAVLEQCGQSGEILPGIASVGITTRNRIDSLERCLRSYIEDLKRYERHHDFVVMDDSETSAARTSNKEMLAQLKQEYDVEISYAGLEEKTQFAKSLVAEGHFDPKVVNFALTDSDDHEFSCGKNRNALFLQTIGELIFSTDDDAVCRIVAPPESVKDFEQEPRGQLLTPVEFWFFADREETLGSVSFVDEDILAAHEQLLGRQLGDCLNSFGNVSLLSMQRPLSHHLRSLRAGPGRVLVTLTGMVGDSGIRLPVTYRVLDRRSRERLISSEASYLSGCLSRELLRVATRACLSHDTWFVSTALGFDNRELLPPFFPVLRGSDGIFAELLRLCFEYGYLGDVPRAILHAPMPPRTYRREAVTRSVTSVTMDSLVSACLSSQRFWPGLTNATERMRALGKHLIEIGSTSLEEFEEFVRIHVWQMQSAVISNLEKDLMDYRDAPAYWASDLKAHLALRRDSLTKPEYLVPGELLEYRSFDEARELSRSLVIRFGQLLCNWPDIMEAARILRARGERLASSV
jgi:hypothetical protein